MIKALFSADAAGRLNVKVGGGTLIPWWSQEGISGNEK